MIDATNRKRHKVHLHINGCDGMLGELVRLHVAVQFGLRHVALLVSDASHHHLIAVGVLASKWLVVRVHTQLVDLQVRPPHKSLLTSRHIAFILLVNLPSTPSANATW